MEQTAIFVYGTLMQGQRANYMLADGQFCGRFRLADYGLYNLGRYPGIRPLAGGSVLGEVYLISEDMLPAMDEYEEEGTLYHRRQVRVSNGQDERTVWAYVYAKEIEGEPMGELWI